jgi:MoxR-like ATPase
MVEEDAYCIDVIRQIQAVEAALNKVSSQILEGHLNSCVITAVQGSDKKERERDIFNRTKNKFELRKGPIFTNILLADEINRASSKTQSALLEAMQEGQVTLEGETLRLPELFLVLAAQNPIESEGTFPLPDAQLNRFMLKMTGVSHAGGGARNPASPPRTQTG